MSCDQLVWQINSLRLGLNANRMHPSPIISSSSALLITLSFALIYVGSLYISKNARLSFVSKPYRARPGREDEEREKMKNERWRDDPDVIRARLAAVSVATAVCCLVVFAVLFYHVGSRIKVCSFSCYWVLLNFYHRILTLLQNILCFDWDFYLHLVYLLVLHI